MEFVAPLVVVVLVVVAMTVAVVGLRRYRHGRVYHAFSAAKQTLPPRYDPPHPSM
jgi:hypothetical protein